jgi:hypothetical protein
MQDKCTFNYAIVRVVPRVDREEFINVGAILSCPAKQILQARIELDEPRLLAFAPDIDMKIVKQHLDSIPAICAGGDEAGPIGLLPQRARFYWLTAPRSTIIQTSTVHTGLSATPESALEHLLNTMVRQSK